MVGENFEIYSVQITRKCICDSKIENRNFYSCPQAKLSSGSHYHLHTNIVPLYALFNSCHMYALPLENMHCP